MEVTTSLHTALTYIRRPDSARLVWVDAICINQSDDDEKSSQVAIMRHIYSAAQSTLIWLGEEANGSSAAFQLIRDILRAAELDKVLGIEIRNLWDLNEDNWGLPLTTNPIWYDLFALIQRPWFRCAWIVQELSVSLKALVMCGDEALPWSQLMEAFLYISAGGLTVAFAPVALNHFMLLNEARDSSKQPSPQPALNVLVRHRQTHVSDSRDKIFAFSGLINGLDGDNPAVKPNYGVSVGDIYINFAVQTLRTSQDLKIFSVPRVQDDSKIDDLPSWVPDWSVFDQTGSLQGWEVRKDREGMKRQVFTATGSSRCTPIFDNNCKRLGVKGAIVDRILLASPECPSVPDKPDLMQTNDTRGFIERQRILNKWELVSGGRIYWRDYFTGEKMPDIYWQTLLAGTIFVNYEASKHLFHKWARSIVHFRILQFLRLDRVWFFEIMHWIVTNICVVASFFGFQRVVDFFVNFTPETLFPMKASPRQNRRMILTQHRCIGLAPKLTREDGDYVALCEGGALPLIVRPKGDDWELVGDAYIHGMMTGEIYDRLKHELKHEFQTMWFV